MREDLAYVFVENLSSTSISQSSKDGLRMVLLNASIEARGAGGREKREVIAGIVQS